MGVSGTDSRPSSRRERLFGYDLAFNDEGCAELRDEVVPLVQFLCLHGTPTEQDELLRVLRSFRRIETP
ncbi:MAG: hypothetical protein AAGE52_04980 [Myxococcota bacterium]